MKVKLTNEEFVVLISFWNKERNKVSLKEKEQICKINDRIDELSKLRQLANMKYYTMYNSFMDFSKVLLGVFIACIVIYLISII